MKKISDVRDKMTISQARNMSKYGYSIDDIKVNYLDGSFLCRSFLSHLSRIIGKRGKVQTVHYKSSISNHVIKRDFC
jgi:hypothetical protein